MTGNAFRSQDFAVCQNVGTIASAIRHACGGAESCELVRAAASVWLWGCSRTAMSTHGKGGSSVGMEFLRCYQGRSGRSVCGLSWHARGSSQLAARHTLTPFPRGNSPATKLPRRDTRTDMRGSTVSSLCGSGTKYRRYAERCLRYPSFIRCHLLRQSSSRSLIQRARSNWWCAGPKSEIEAFSPSALAWTLAWTQP